MNEELYRQIAAWRLELDRFPGRRTHHRLAEALLAAGRPREALQIADKGLATQPRYLACLDVKGQSLLALHRWREAAEVFTVVAERVDSAEVQRHLAMALLGAGDEAQARAIFARMLQANPLDVATKQLFSLGADALPPLSAEDRPLPEAAAPAQPPAATPPSAPEPPGAMHLWPPPCPEGPSPPAPEVAEKPAAPPAPVLEKNAPPAASNGIAAPALDALTTEETDRLVENFFTPLLSTADSANADPAARAEPAAPISAEPLLEEEHLAFAPEPPAAPAEAMSAPAEVEDGAEPAHEYDPTTAMTAEIDVAEVDVFGEMPHEHATPPRPDEPPPPIEPSAIAPPVAAAETAPPPVDRTPPASPAAEPIALNSVEASPPVEPARAAADAAAVNDTQQKKKRGFWKSLFRRKE